MNLNYRLVSILSTFSKNFEKSMFAQIFAQHGFQKVHCAQRCLKVRVGNMKHYVEKVNCLMFY